MIAIFILIQGAFFKPCSFSPLFCSREEEQISAVCIDSVSLLLHPPKELVVTLFCSNLTSHLSGGPEDLCHICIVKGSETRVLCSYR